MDFPPVVMSMDSPKEWFMESRDGMGMMDDSHDIYKEIYF